MSYVGNANKSRYWRKRIMAEDFSVPLRIDKHSLGSTIETGLYVFVTKAVSQYNLDFQVTKLPYHEEGLAEGSYVTFRFQSVEFPEILFDTYNNVEA